jgi:hypothetical protein
MLTSKKHAKVCVDALIDNGRLSDRATYVCTVCVQHAYSNLLNVNPEPDQKSKIATAFDDVISDITSNTVADAEQHRLCAALGESLCEDVNADASSIKKLYQQV